MESAFDSWLASKQLHRDYISNKYSSLVSLAKHYGLEEHEARRKIENRERIIPLENKFTCDLWMQVLYCSPSYRLFRRVIDVLAYHTIYGVPSFLGWYDFYFKKSPNAYVKGVGPLVNQVINDIYESLSDTEANKITKGGDPVEKRRPCKFCGAPASAIVTETMTCSIFDSKTKKARKPPKGYLWQIRISTCSMCDNVVRCGEPKLISKGDLANA